MNKVALCTQPDESAQYLVERGPFQYTMQLFRALASEYECEVVCHYVDELKPLRELGLPVRYSYDAGDYAAIYDEFDLSVTTRVHGAGICASLGVPSFLVAHSARSQTGDGFLVEYLQPDSTNLDQTLQRIRDFDVESRSRALIEHKRETGERYTALIREALRDHLPAPTRADDVGGDAARAGGAT